MSRPIKFRGKRVDNGEWIMGTGIVQLNYHDSVDYVEETQIVLHNGHTFPVIPETVGQYTGLKDRKEVELFEGDIVQAYRSGRKDLKFEIKYDGKQFVMWQDGDESYMDCLWFFEYEIIGNIHDNPELLNK